VATYVPYSESSMSRCGGDTHRYCDLFLAFAPAGGDTRPAVGEVEVPIALWYAKNHLWLDVGEGGACHVGVDALLARVLGSVERVIFTTEKGTRRPSAVLSVKGVDVTVTFPNAFRLTATNPALRAHPERLVEDPYGTGWLFEGFEAGSSAAESLLPGASAFDWMRGEVGRLDAFVHAAISRPGADGVRLVADGGSFAPGLIRELGPEERLALLDGFFSAEARS
jgi:glycine cleavage system H lipoate-binding protein